MKSKFLENIEKFEWKHHNLILLAISIIIAYHILTFESITNFLKSLGDLGYLASFLGGMLFSYGLTTPIATAMLFDLAKNTNPVLIAIIGAFGAVLSDYIIFRFVKSRLLNEINLLSHEIKNIGRPVSSLLAHQRIIVKLWHRISKSKIWHVIIPVVAGFVIASPLPDEIGVALFGAVKFSPKKFLVLAYIFNFIGILAIGYSTTIFG